METRDALQKRFESQLHEIKAEIEKIEAKAKAKQADAQIESQEKLEELRRKRERTEQKLEDLRNAGESAWADAKAGVELAVTDLKTALESAKSRF